MFKRIVSVFSMIVLVLALCACEEEKNEAATTQKSEEISRTEVAETEQPAEDETSPEDIAKDFVLAMYSHDVDKLVGHFPEFTYDVIIGISEGEITVGADGNKAEAIYNYFQKMFSDEKKDIESINIETKISETMTKDTYMNDVKSYYVSEGLVSEADFEKIEDVVFVSFNSDVKYKDGTGINLTDFKASIPCVKVDGKWYADFIYTTISVQATPPQQSIEKVPVSN